MAIYQKCLLTDVDGVKLKWKPKFEHFVRNVIGRTIEKDFAAGYAVEDWLEIHPHEAFDLIDQFHHSDEFSQLEPYDDALEYINRFRDCGWKIVAITACGTSQRVRDLRTANLVKCFGDIYDDIHFVGHGADKEEFLSRYQSAVWVEDTWVHALAGHRLGHHTYLINRAYNALEHHQGPRVVGGWREVFEETEAEEK